MASCATISTTIRGLPSLSAQISSTSRLGSGSPESACRKLRTSSPVSSRDRGRNSSGDERATRSRSRNGSGGRPWPNSSAGKVATNRTGAPFRRRTAQSISSRLYWSAQCRSSNTSTSGRCADRARISSTMSSMSPARAGAADSSTSRNPAARNRASRSNVSALSPLSRRPSAAKAAPPNNSDQRPRERARSARWPRATAHTASRSAR